MEFRFTPEQQEWRDEVREFFEEQMTEELKNEIRERRDPFSEKLWRSLAKAGYLGLSWPKEYGGLEKDVWQQLIFQEEAVLNGCPAAVMSCMSDISLLGKQVLHFGTQEQKDRLLPAIMRGELTAAEGLTEPGAGSDLAGLESKAIRDGDDWVLNGAKVFNLAHLTTHFLVLARTDPDRPRHRGLSFLLVDMKAPGVSFTPLVTMGRWRRNAVYFEDVRIPAANLIGEVNRGWYQYVAPTGGLAASMHVLADAKLAFNDLVDYVKNQERDGVLLAEIPWVRQAVADLSAELQSATLLCWRVVDLNARGLESTKYSAMTKIWSSEVQEKILSTGLDIIGPEGALESWGADVDGIPLRGRFPELYRTTRVWFIAGGTNEIKRNIIAQRGLDLPRD
jgi:alkylation response protein AidB-like acyl-CoA dehydrogenase